MHKSLMVVLAVFVGLIIVACAGGDKNTTVQIAATRTITVSGSGNLQEVGGKFRVTALCQPLIELGVVDDDTLVDTYDTHLTPRGWGQDDLIRSHYLGHLVGVIARVEVEVDSEQVFRAVRTRRLIIFRHSDGLPAEAGRPEQ
ncbi:MAG: hypothetical protein AAB375_03710 [Patescibacteria group bacterium]